MNPTQEAAQPQAAAPQELIPAPQQAEARAVTKFTAAHGVEVGLPSPEAVNYMMSVAKLLLDSSLITKDMGNTIEQIRSNALAKMLVGHELKMQPMEALQDIDIVKGKVFVRYPQLINQLILRGFKWKWVERSNTRAAMEVTRPGMDEPELFEYTIEDAKLAGLVYGPDSQYVKRPRVMLTARVVSEAYRSTGGRSNVYAPEERAEVLDEVRQTERAAPAAVAENPYAPKIKDAPKAGGPQADPTPEANDIQVEGPDTSTRAAAGSSAPAQQAGESGGAVAAALPKSGTGEGPAADASVAALDPGQTSEGGAPLAAALGTAKVTSIAKPKQDPRVPELLAQIEKLLPAKQRKKIAEDYLRGYFNVTDVKQVMQDPRMFDAATMLLALCENWRVQLIGDPHKYGVAAKLGWDKLQDFIKDWPEPQRMLAGQMALQYADTGGEGLYDYFAALDLDKADPENRGVFLAVVGRIGIGKSASALWDCGMPVKEVVAGWGLDLATCEPAEIVARIGDLEPAAMAAGSEEEEPSFDLFERGGSEDLGK